MGDLKQKVEIIEKTLEYFGLPINSKVVDFALRSSDYNDLELTVTLINPGLEDARWNAMLERPPYTDLEETPPPF